MAQQYPAQPIVSLSPFISNQWWIKARITDKSPIRTWNNAKGSGKLFSCTFVDESASIKATFFQAECDQWEPKLVPNKIYYISGAQIKPANKKFSNVNNEYELTMNSGCQFVECNDNVTNIPTHRYNFKPIQVLQQREAGTLIDVLGVVTEISDVANIMQKATGKSLTKRTIKIADSTAAVDLTIWEEKAQSWNYPVGTIIGFTSLKIGSWDGVSLSTTAGTSFDLNPNCDDTKKLASWFNTTGGTDVQSLTVKGAGAGGEKGGENFRGRKFFEDIEREGMGRGEKPDFIDVRCVPTHIRVDQLYYDACPACKKKVVASSNDQYRCEKCDKDLAAPVARYLTSMMLSDNVTQLWVSMFDECGEAFFGCTAQKIKEMSGDGGAAVAALIQEKLHQPILAGLRVKEDSFQTQTGESGQRVKVTLNRVKFINDDQSLLANECNEMMKYISLY